jgi:hypothetical protein
VKSQGLIEQLYRDRYVGFRNALAPVVGSREAALQRAILAEYGTTFRLVRSYACNSKAECVGEFAARSGQVHLTFGTRPSTGTWLTIWK